MTHEPNTLGGNPLRSTRRGPDGLTHTRPLPVTEVANPCPVCHNTAYLQEDWRPETGYDRRMRQFKCMQGHEHYTIPRHSSTVLEPPQKARRTGERTHPAMGDADNAGTSALEW